MAGDLGKKGGSIAPNVQPPKVTDKHPKGSDHAPDGMVSQNVDVPLAPVNNTKPR